MLRFIERIVGQYGPPPNRGTGSTILIIAAIIVVLLIIIAVILLFPRLRNVKPSKSIEPEVKRIESKTEKNNEEVDPLTITLRLLNDEEKRVVEALNKAGGTMLQKDISYELGLSRVKTHRTLAKLIDMDVVTAEKYFNTNRIRLANWLRNNESRDDLDSVNDET